MRTLRSLVLIPALAASAAARAVGTFEDLGPDGTAVTMRVIDGVTVSLSTSTMSLEARTYGSATECNAIIFGLLAGTVIAVVIIPCLYLLLTRDRVAVQ